VQGGHQEAGARLLLTGVILAAGWGALITLILAIAPESRLRGMLFWLTGDLGGTATYGAALATLIAALLLAMPMARALNVMLLARPWRNRWACAGRVRLATFLISSISIAAAITTAGSIGFAWWCRTWCAWPGGTTSACCCRRRCCWAAPADGGRPDRAYRLPRRNCRWASSRRCWACRPSSTCCCGDRDEPLVRAAHRLSAVDAAQLGLHAGSRVLLDGLSCRSAQGSSGASSARTGSASPR
jgi:hypothetical protein